MVEDVVMFLGMILQRRKPIILKPKKGILDAVLITFDVPTLGIGGLGSGGLGSGGLGSGYFG